MIGASVVDRLATELAVISRMSLPEMLTEIEMFPQMNATENRRCALFVSAREVLGLSQMALAVRLGLTLKQFLNLEQHHSPIQDYHLQGLYDLCVAYVCR